jgi:DNA-binding GntR family transcriptional regulator
MMSERRAAAGQRGRAAISDTQPNTGPGSAGMTSGALAWPETLHAQAYEHIRAAIIAGEIEPGQLYSVNQFAAIFGVSRTPVREALLVLERQGILRMDRNRGFRVLTVSRSDLAEIIDLRRLLEIPAMEQLAAMDPAPSEALLEARRIYADLQQAADSDDLLEFLALDRRFHLALTGALGNGRLTRLVDELRDHMQLPGLRRITELRQLHGIGLEHLTLLAAIESGDATQAGAVMRAHLDHTQADWA